MIQHSRVMTIPPILSVRHRAPAAAVPWWLSGGVAAGNAVAVYQPIRSASLAASYVNLANPGTHDAAPGVAPTFNAATGWTGNNNAYLTTGVTPASGWSAVCRFSGLSTSDNNQVLMGSYTGDQNYFFLQPRFELTVSRYYANGGISSAVSGRLTAGVMAVAGTVGYLNGAVDVTGIGAWSGTGKPIFLLNVNANGTPDLASFITGSIQAVAIYDTTLTAPQVAAISAAMAAL